MMIGKRMILTFFWLFCDFLENLPQSEQCPRPFLGQQVFPDTKALGDNRLCAGDVLVSLSRTLYYARRTEFHRD